jgi:hypothetical protein
MASSVVVCEACKPADGKKVWEGIVLEITPYTP